MGDYYNANDGVFGRTGGPYLDVEQDKAEERRRATVEGREPDLENPLPSAGTLLVPAELLVQRFNATHLDNQELRKFDGTVEAPIRASVPDEVLEDTQEEVETSEENSEPPVDNQGDLNLV